MASPALTGDEDGKNTT